MNTQESPGQPIVYTVQQYLWPLWHDVLTTGDRANAFALKDKLGDKARVVQRVAGINDVK